MNNTTNDTETAQVKVVAIISPYRLVINKGATADIKIGQRFLVYNIGKEIIDPDTKESLGNLEIVKGTGQVVHVQPHMAHIQSDMKRHVHKTRHNPFSYRDMFLGEETINTTEEIPFEDAEVGDLVKTV